MITLQAVLDVYYHLNPEVYAHPVKRAIKLPVDHFNACGRLRYTGYSINFTFAVPRPRT